MVAFQLFQIPCIHCIVQGEIILSRQHKATLNNSMCEQSCSIHAMFGNMGVKCSQKHSSSTITHRPLHCLYGGLQNVLGGILEYHWLENLFSRDCEAEARF